jgi:hypothetical protein
VSAPRARGLAGLAFTAVAAAGIAAGIAFAPIIARTQGAPEQGAPEPGASLRISVITFGQGDAVYELFGHNALRIRDLATGEDVAYNWGMFDFEEPRFLRRFLTGDTRYWVEAFPTSLVIDVYLRQDRETVEQELALTPAQRAAVAAEVRQVALPDNRYYRYDYFLDNCSTRIRDVIDRALGGSLERRFSTLRTPWTFRSESVRLTAPNGFAQAGIDLALGPRADAPITAWEAMFIPMRLRDHLREVTVPAAGGGTEPLVREERRLHATGRAPEAEARRGLRLGAWGPVLGAWMLLLAPFGATARRRTRTAAAVMAAGWYAITGVLGTALLGMWLWSAHVFWYRNLALLLVSPLGLIAAFPVARAILRGRADRLAALSVVTLGSMAVVALLLAPVVSQRLGGPLLLLLPAHLGLAVAFWRHTRHLPGATPAP